ncbi:pyruvate dehydrogenase E1 component subunit alpha type II, mitochondrial-like isoform X2 [Homalodisca vitripennis]|uniref:pyruvate dehydrogenase E1 component subunit alpha type II, mitochondrial-like isoform X2 n=1 Tax=Homalodisca vitripennis TaxID=197043 RepID=UPI001EECECBF|nr:pyruvate dehydrogenase E1 component subunit alpha type II, mitochondrial-like isoform X2 [Homalodisca vitripennis]
MLNRPNCVKVLLRQVENQRAISFFGSSKKNYATEATFETKPFKLHKLESGPPTSVTISRDEAIKFYKQMQTIRRIETASGNLYKEKIIRGFCHLYSGQEACAVGMKAAMRPNDSIISAYRVHGWTYLMDVSVVGVLAELTGRKSGCARGKGGSMHMYSKNFYGGNGIVGAQVPLGTGVAFANKYLGHDGVCFTLYGDGAANQGQVFEAYNMAKLWDVPCIYVCENNGYGMGTSAERAAASTAYYSRGDYVPGIWVDGMDVLAVKSASMFAVNHCTSGKGPIVMETATYRYSGHSMSDPGTSYRTRDEIQEVRQTRDPITSFKEKILNSGLVTADELKKLDGEIKAIVDAAVKQAKSDAEVGMDDLAGDIYVNNLEGKIRGTVPWHQLEHKRIGTAANV